MTTELPRPPLEYPNDRPRQVAFECGWYKAVARDAVNDLTTALAEVERLRALILEVASAIESGAKDVESVTEQLTDGRFRAGSER
jgi:hypothetical protein